MTRRQLAAEVAVVALLLFAGFEVGSFTGSHFAGQSLFYQDEFGPAVMIAAGRGFVNPVAEPGSPLEMFLSVRRPSLERADAMQVRTRGLDQFQYATRYLMLSVGYTWRILGISWAAVSDFAALLFALTVAVGYAICRLWLPRLLATAGALLICFSPFHLQQLPQVRDYSKEPFILLALLLAVVVSVRPLAWWGRVLLSAACGLVVGIGLGFKMDVVIMAPVFLASLIMFSERRPWAGLGIKALAAAAFAVTLTATAAPVVSSLSAGGSNGFHVILLGYSDPFDAPLGVNRSVYSFLPFYSDVYVTTAVKSHAVRTTGQIPAFPSPEYDAAGRSYWLRIVRHFPADILTRALGASNRVLNMPFEESALNFLKAPDSRANPFWNLLTNQVPHRARIGAVFEWLALLGGWGLVFAVTLVAAAAARSVRLGLFAAWIILALTGYSSLQLDPRHYFHLEIIPLLCFLVTVDLIMRRRLPETPVVFRFAGAIVVLVLAVMTSVGVLRAYQRVHVRHLLQDYVDAPREPVEARFLDSGDGSWRVKWNAPPALTRIAYDYYVVEFDGSSTPGRSALAVRYASATPGNDFSRVIWMGEEPGINRVFIPAYGEPPAWAFDGIELPSGIRNRLRGVYRVARLEQLPLLLDLRLPGGWKEDALVQTFRFGDSAPADNIQVLGSVGGSAPLVALIGRVDAAGAKPNPSAVDVAYTKAVRVTGNGIEMDGDASTQSAYVLQFKPVSVTAPAALLVKGHLYAGGLAFGLLKDGRWYRNVGTGTPGDFIAVVDITEAGTYTPIVTNATRRDHDRNHFELSRFGVMTVADMSR